jgi:predicted adenine nucleotide alpha hydrolase (AANH) superfamily ATPase
MNQPKPAILLHICCAPCGTHVARELSERYSVRGFFFNPNIQPEEEYRLRENEARALAEKDGFPLEAGGNSAEAWLEAVRGLEGEPEGGRRCEACYRHRLERTAAAARDNGIPFFTTTLTISPLKKASVINPIGLEAARLAGSGVQFIEADFKKKDGFKKSCALSKALGFYRQNYCGCLFSRR